MNERSVGKLPSGTWLKAHAVHRFPYRPTLDGSSLRRGEKPRLEAINGQDRHSVPGFGRLWPLTAYSMHIDSGSR
jgi:hypothetical protein